MGQVSGIIHVWDLARPTWPRWAVRCLPGPATAINLGTGRGTTVRELLDAFNHVADTDPGPRGRARPGDIARAYTRIDRAERLLGWRPQYDITDRIRHSLRWARSVTRPCPVTRLRGSSGSVLWSADPAFGSRRSSCRIPGRSGCSGCTRRPCSNPRCVRCSYRSRRRPRSAGGRCGMPNCWPGAARSSGRY